MLSVFTAASKAILAALGEDGLLRGDTPCKIIIQHNVQLTGLDDAYESAASARVLSSAKSVATIESVYNPKRGDAFTHPEGTFKLDTKVGDSGSSRRFIVLKIA